MAARPGKPPTFFFGGAVNPRNSDLTITEDGDDIVYNGHKSFSTGSKVSDLTVLEGILEGTEDHVFAIVPSKQDGIVFHDDWDNLGQRLTESGSVSITDVRVPWASAAGYVDRKFHPLTYNTLNVPAIQLVFTNFYLGIAQGALEAGLTYTRERTRPWPYGGDDKDAATEEWYILDGYGDLQAKLWAAEALTDKAGAAISRVLHAPREELMPEARGELAVLIAAAKQRVIETGLEIGTRIFELTGARASAAKYGLDRFWRNLRTHSLHGPVACKRRGARADLVHLSRSLILRQPGGRHRPTFGGRPCPDAGAGRSPEATMKALVYHGPGAKAWEDVPDAVVQEPTDVVVRVDTTTICGTDLHILQGDVAAVTDGRILGHEAVGTVTAVGDAVRAFKTGDRVLVPAITQCGRCEYCGRGMPSHCQTVGGIGWIFGHLIDGTQAELVRVPFADTSLYAVPDDVTNEQAIFLADSLPTGYEVGVLAGRVRPGDTVAVVGAGAVGLSAILTTGLWGASKVIAVDSNKFRLEKALDFGATDAIEAGPDTRADVLAMTDGLGVDVSIEAVGYPQTLQTAASLVRPGGRIANIGVHGVPVELPMQEMWIQNVTLTMGLVDTVSIPTLLKMVSSGRIPAEKMGTHTFTFGELDEAYEVFANAAANSALKVVITP